MDCNGETFHPRFYGVTKYSKLLIEILQNLPLDQARDTLMHEMLHAALCTGGVSTMFELDEDSEEKLVRLLTPLLLGVIAENPELIRFLSGANSL